MIDTEIRPEVRDAVESLVRSELGAFGVARVETVEAEDHDGDAVIRVLIHYGDGDAAPDPNVAAGLITKLNDRLFELKERRFGHITHRIPELPTRAVRR